MKLNRRGFFGVSAGAALAAPTVAKSSLSGDASTAISGAVGPVEEVPMPDSDWRLKTITSLVRQARGERTPEQESERATFQSSHHIMNARLHDIDTLKSVAPRYKHIMAHRLSEREQEKKQRLYAVHRLLYEFNIPVALWKDYE